MIGKGKAGDSPHIGIAIAASGLMALGLSAGLVILKLMAGVDALLAGLFIPRGITAPANPLSPWLLWTASALLAFALPAAILNIPSTWRRSLVWIATLTLTLTWGAVLMLAFHKPTIGVAVIAVLWSGFCAMFYAHSHILPVDKTTLNKTTDGSR